MDQDSVLKAYGGVAEFTVAHRMMDVNIIFERAFNNLWSFRYWTVKNNVDSSNFSFIGCIVDAKLLQAERMKSSNLAANALRFNAFGCPTQRESSAVQSVNSNRSHSAAGSAASNSGYKFRHPRASSSSSKRDTYNTIRSKKKKLRKVAEGSGKAPCAFYARGDCRNGDQCEFSHEVNSSLTKTNTAFSTLKKHKSKRARAADFFSEDDYSSVGTPSTCDVESSKKAKLLSTEEEADELAQSYGYANARDLNS